MPNDSDSDDTVMRYVENNARFHERMAAEQDEEDFQVQAEFEAQAEHQAELEVQWVEEVNRKAEKLAEDLRNLEADVRLQEAELKKQGEILEELKKLGKIHKELKRREAIRVKFHRHFLELESNSEGLEPSFFNTLRNHLDTLDWDIEQVEDFVNSAADEKDSARLEVSSLPYFTCLYLMYYRETRKLSLGC